MAIKQDQRPILVEIMQDHAELLMWVNAGFYWVMGVQGLTRWFGMLIIGYLVRPNEGTN